MANKILKPISEYSLVFGEDVSTATLQRVPHLKELASKLDIPSPMGMGKMASHLMKMGPQMLHCMYGNIGLALMPLHLIGVAIIMAVKLLLLNPPGFEGLQDAGTFECKAHIVDTDDARSGLQRAYSTEWQMNKRPKVGSCFTASSNGMWWERIQMSHFVILPMLAMMYQFSKDDDSLSRPSSAGPKCDEWICVYLSRR
ncbi:expressed unknown protein [Seminavis robusta]|uniref:Uncharacterized protein n=1 Tax=Seminavis robusta TaxID=568900 RepID=A0A9N8HMP4_9STRA|nr:expressed unknown protein [Seminavis robusta]|eukprot:Sro917_g219870.1 n/a (199) ;mRNA; f:10683-11279